MDALIWIVRLFRAYRPRADLAVNGAGAFFCDEEDDVSDLLMIKRGDTAPPLTLTLTDGGTPVDLTGATVRVIALDRVGATVIDDDTLSGSDVGVVVRPWQSADTATARQLTVEVEVTWPDTTVQTFPAAGTLTVRIVPDLA